MRKLHPALRRVGYFGSYARNDWGVGSDLDVILIVDHTDLPFERRAAAWDLNELPVPADVLVYTRPELDRLRQSGNRFAHTIKGVVWIT